MFRSRRPAGTILATYCLVLAACGSEGGSPFAGISTPVLVSESLRFKAIAASGVHTCGVAQDGATWCWGKSEYGALGTSAPLDLCDIPRIELVPCTSTPQRVTGGEVYTALVANLGNERTCGLTAAGAVWCWGDGQLGQLGDGSGLTHTATPVRVATTEAFTQLWSSITNQVSCALSRSGEGWCWGDGYQIVGDPALNLMRMPVPVRVDWGRRFVTIDLGLMHGCGLTAEGQAWCWGNNWYGNLGVGSAGANGGLEDSTIPLEVVGGGVYRSIATGSDHSCALDETGAAWCWGASNSIGSVADGYVATPQAVAGGHIFTALKSGQRHTCGLTAQGEIWCWGQNFIGQLGDGSRTDAQVPVRVKANVRFDRLAHRATCALTSDGQAWCWGDNYFGQVGRRSVFAQ